MSCTKENAVLSGKTCLVTGASSSLGLAVSRKLANKGANTILLCRNRQKGERAIRVIENSVQNASVELMICDLASLRSIRSFIAQFKEKYSRLDILLNNAAVMKQKRTMTGDGLEMMFQVNYLAPLIFMNSFLNNLRNGSDALVLNIARPEYKLRLDMDDLQFERKYSMWHSFFKTKLCLLLAGLEMSRRHGSDGVSFMMADTSRPFKSALARDVPLVGWIKNLFSVSADIAAGDIMHVIGYGIIKNSNGKVFKGKNEWPLSEYWKDADLGKRLWSSTESLLEDVRAGSKPL